MFGKDIECTRAAWRGTFWETYWDVNPVSYVVLPPEPGSDETQGRYYTEQYYGQSKQSWEIRDGVIGDRDYDSALPMIQSKWYRERTSDGQLGVQYWSDDGQRITYCYREDDDHLIPTGGNTDATTGNCDYSDAEQYDGWGWNPVTQMACAPLQQDGNSTNGNATTGINECSL